MIPHRIKLAGFLSYTSEQEVRFDEAPLWMLSGSNGSGKSSIFDALTFALFGSHRGGSQSAAELINKESNTLTVEFDFSVDGRLYRIKRTVRRRTSGVASTQQIMQRVPSTRAPEAPGSAGESSAAEEDWEAIPDTTYKAKFDLWVRDKIGLDYETFTSSVLLLQGKSEKLLDSTPAGRASVLARIVDLERYQRLHARADDQRKHLKGQLEGIVHQLSGLRDVHDEELAAAANRIASVQTLRAAVETRLEALNTVERQAQRWADARGTLAASKARLAKAEQLLGHAVAIEKQYTRLRELRDVLPAVTIIVTEYGRIAESERQTEKLAKQREEKLNRGRQCDHVLAQAKKKLAALKKTLTEDEAKLQTLNARLRELAAMVEKVKRVEECEAEERRLERELQPLPGDPDTVVRQLQAEQERLTLLSQHRALLERLHQDRSELTKVVLAGREAQAEELRLLNLGKSAKSEFDALRQRIVTVQEARGRAEEAAAEARGLSRQARLLADDFERLTGAKTCNACGQPLTPEHFEYEKKKRELNARAAERKLEALVAAAASARQAESEALARESSERQRLETLRDQYKDASAAVRQNAGDSKRLMESCRQSYFALSDEFKLKFGRSEPADWSAVTYPDRVELTELSAQVQGLEGVKRRLRQALEEARTVQTLRTRLDAAREALAKARQCFPAGDPHAIRQEHAAKQGEEVAVTNTLTATRRAIETVDQEIERHNRELLGLNREITELAGKLNLEEATRKQSTEAIDRARAGLPPAWQDPMRTAGLTDQLRWKEEYETLTDSGVEAQYTQLQAVRGGLDSLRAEIDQHEQEVSAFPVEVRREPESLRAEILAAKQELEERNRELLDAERQKGMLEEYRRQREELNSRFKAVDAQLHRFKTLTELLGRDRLQRFLVRTAERQIVDYANAVLDRLSSGQLFLRLVGSVESDGPTEKALELECANRVTGGAAINVAFLSGSQRFRVAVALALGIGQYASKQHRPIESVIIDEGFGCLDRSGRQVMIQELQNLRGHLRCILLVSHQEEFADAFADGYRFELQDGTTKVSRQAR